MPAPTRPQIEATIALPTFLIEIDDGSGYVSIDNAEVKSIDTKIEATNNVDNGFAFGTITSTESSVEIADTTEITNWQLAKIRIRYGFSTSDKIVAFEGIIIQRQHVGHMYVYQCAGFSYLIERTKAYTGIFYRRAIATKTTALSIENVADVNYSAGLLNYIMWVSGGRPFEQPALVTDPGFKFWYSFDESIVKPRYSWLSGDNAWDEVNKLVRAAGGQLYQDIDGVIRYKQPLTFGYVETGATLYEFDETTYTGITEESSTVENFTTVKASFIERVLQPMQQVHESSSPVLLPAAETTDVNVELQYPIYQFAEYVNSDDLITNGSAVKSTFLDGRNATTDPDFTVIFSAAVAAQLLQLGFVNATGEPIALNKLVLEGRPITPGSEGLATYSTGPGSELQLEENIYIQSFAQAYRLVRMFYDFYHTNRAIRTLTGVGYDPDRYLGEVVELTYSEWDLANDRHRIIGLEYTNGSEMTVRLVPIEGLPTRDDVFIVGETYINADVRMVSY